MGKPASPPPQLKAGVAGALAGGYVITSATITITVDDTAKTVNFIVSGDEGRAKTIAAYVLAMIDADKRERCGGDWGMHDRVRMVIPWDEELQRIYREHGYEIPEPVEFPAPVTSENFLGREEYEDAMTSTATITVEADASGAAHFIILGDEGPARDFAEDVMKMVAATQPENFLGPEEHEVQ
jgi:hypothetical protein